MRERLLVVDGNSLMHRAFHALPLLDNDGVYTNAVHGFLMMLLKAVEDHSPRYAAVAFDEKAPTFRHQIYEGYKAGRKPTPPELVSQFSLIREILSGMGLGVLSAPGWEADDILGTLAAKCRGADLEAILLTGDRDALQLVSDASSVLFTRKGITDTLLFTPALVREIYGVSPEQITDLKGLMGDSSDNIPGVPGVGEKTAVKLLSEYHDLESVLAAAERLSGKLGEKIRANADLARFSKQLATIRPEAPVPFEPEKWLTDHMADADGLFARYQLRGVRDRVRKLSGGAPAEPETPAETLPEPRVITRMEELTGFVRDIRGEAAVYITAQKGSIAWGDECVVFDFDDSLLSAGITFDGAMEALGTLFERQGVVTHDVKSLWHRLEDKVPHPDCLWDTMLAQYLLDPLAKGYALSRFVREDAAGILKLWREQRAALEKAGMTDVMTRIEMPLARVLYEMETAGFRVDVSALKDLGAQWSAQAEQLKEKVYDLAGTRGFNLNSPQQLSRVLFEEMGLPHGKKTASGAYTTDADTLEKLQDDYPVAKALLEYRQVVKLNSTYVDALIRKTDREGRIHTVFDQTGTATGRISSSEPNLQNIPVRTAMGREIRRAFIPSPGWVLCDADYSQIELRVLAHLSGDAGMTDAFNKGQDIHARTASEVYGVPMDEVDAGMRRSAKAVNFGLVYGLSEFGLARNIGISRWEAHDFIQRYFERYPGVKRYMDDAVRRGYDEGFTQTALGRRRALPELKSSNGNTRSFGERVAMNAPVQGTAADIIKLAMILVSREMKQRRLRARLILQVHDELLIECPPEELGEVTELLRDCMEKAYPLRVPLVAEVHTGESWYDTK
ncbi:MAG: DNA polymerase I [Clostridia bacterium]|nr:DNA polymerase I [Clostridia bacterium]